MKDGFIKVAAAVPHIRVADTERNADAVIELSKSAAEKGVKICVFPELCITGSTCGDLFLRDTLINGAQKALLKVAEETAGLDMLIAVGLPVLAAGKIYNCAAAVFGGEIYSIVPKTRLAAAEMRHFAPWDEDSDAVTVSLLGQDGRESLETLSSREIIKIQNIPGLAVGFEIGSEMLSSDPPSRKLAENGASLILNLSALYETAGGAKMRENTAAELSRRFLCGYVLANAGRGESTTDRVFRGQGIIAENGSLLTAKQDNELVISEIDAKTLGFLRRKSGFSGEKELYFRNNVIFKENTTELTRKINKTPFIPENKAELSEIFDIQCRGLRGRMEHTGSKRLVIGVSGGLDSTLSMLVAAKTLKMMSIPPENLIAVTMPCFGTSDRTRSNAEILAKALGADFRSVDITESVRRHFLDIGHDEKDMGPAYENAQARERTQVIMDIANGEGALAVGTGDMSELALGWTTYNGDHMSMYGVNAGVTKTLVRRIVECASEKTEDPELSRCLKDILDTPVSPELLPAKDGSVSQKTEDIVGPYELHDFFLYCFLKAGYEPGKILRVAEYAFSGEYGRKTISKWLYVFITRFFSQQFKRSCLPDGPWALEISLSPRGGLSLPSDAAVKLWISELEARDE